MIKMNIDLFKFGTNPSYKRLMMTLFPRLIVKKKVGSGDSGLGYEVLNNYNKNI